MSAQSPRRGESGFTLVEMMVSLVIVVIVVAGVYGLYIYMHKTQISQEIKSELQTQSRNTLDFVSRELMMAGYHGGETPIMINGEYKIKFLEATQLAGETMRITYYLKDAYLMRDEQRNDDTAPVVTTKIAGNVKGVAFAYYDRDNNKLGYDGDETLRKKIRRITMMVTMESSKVDPTTGLKRTTVFKADLVPRNLAEGEAPYDTIPPAKPTGLHAVDNRDCTSLQLKWNKNTEADVAGYYIMYGTAPSTYSGVVTVSVNSSGFDKDNPQFKLSGLTPTPYTSRFDSGSVVRYYVAIKAYDNSMNYSVASDEVWGPDDSHLGDDYTAFGSGDDTILNPKKPAPPSNTHAYNRDNNTTGLPWTYPVSSPDGRNQVRLTWTASPEATVGYRIYRSETPFTTFPIPNADGSKTYLIADENGSTGVKLGPSTTTFLDTVDVSCKDFYYAICSVNCDNTQIYGGGGHPALYTSSEYALIGPTQAKDATPPADPNLSGSKGGWKRVFINLVNPNNIECPDFKDTMLYVSDVAPPKVMADGTVEVGDTGSPCMLVFDHIGSPDRGTFCDTGSNAFVFNSMITDLDDYAEPKLENSHTYYFLALAYDKCGNRSAGSGTAQTLATLCGDDPPGISYATPTASADGCGDTITIKWNWPSGDFLAWLDLAGYRVFKRTADGDFSGAFDYNTGCPLKAGTVPLPGNPVWGTSMDDNLTDQDGGKFWYFVRASDCRWENIRQVDPDTGQTITDYDYIKLNNITPFVAGGSSVVGPICPGRIRRFQSDITNNPPSLTSGDDRYNFVKCFGEDPATGSSTYYHNAVKFYIQNTSAGEILLNQLNLTWSNAGAYLKSIKIGGSPGTVAVDTYNFSPPMSSTDMSSGKTLTTLLTDSSARASAVGVYSKAIPVELIFTNSDGSVSQACDMRGDTLNVTIKYQNRSTGKSDCLTEMSAANGNPINVPGTPVIANATQDQPSPGTNCFDVPGSTVPAHLVTDDHPLALGGKNVFVSANIDSEETYNFHDPVTAQTTTQNVLYYSKELDWAMNDIGSTSPPAGSSFTAIQDTNLINDLARFTIPGQIDKRIWFYITVKSNTGNSARLPEVQNGYFMYDQKALTPCDHSPNPPMNLLYKSGGTLTWDPPDHYVDGYALDTATDPLTYDVWRQQGYMNPFTKIASNIAATTYTDTDTLTQSTFYKVVAKNSCQNPGPLSSADSNVAVVCVAGTSACQAWTTTTALQLNTNWTTGSQSCTTKMVDLTVYDCGLACNGKTDTLTVTATSAAGTSTMTFHEKSGDSGVFTYLGTGSANDVIYVNALSSVYGGSASDNVIGATTQTSLNDTITFSVDGCTSTAVVSVTTDPCVNTPNAPAGVSVYRPGKVTGKYPCTVSWTPPSSNTDGSTVNDIAQYKVYVRNKTSGALVDTQVVNAPATSLTWNIGSNTQYKFTVTAIDSCSTGGNESAESTPVTQ